MKKYLNHIQEIIPKIRDGAYVINLDEYKSIRTHWIMFLMNGENVTYFDRFGVEHIPEEIKKFIGNKNITTNIYRIQAHNSIMCRYFCIGFYWFYAKRWKFVRLYQFSFSKWIYVEW